MNGKNMNRVTFFVFFVLLVFLVGCSQPPGSNNGGGPAGTGGPVVEEVRVVLCEECVDGEASTIDLCEFTGETFKSCNNVPRCGDFEFVNGKCDIPPVCGNGVCEEGEVESCPDCSGVLTCPNGGVTGEGAVPRNLFAWDFENVKPDTCDESNFERYNCDALQALIALLHKFKSIESYIQDNGAPSNSFYLDKVGTLSEYGEGIQTSFGMTLLSDNLESKELLKDFETELDSGALSVYRTPTWMEEWKKYLAVPLSENSGLKIEFAKEPEKERLNEKLFPAGNYFVTVNIKFGDGQYGFFSRSGEPSALITINLQKKSDLRESIVMDLAFDGQLGKENPNRDYGIRWPLSSPPIGLSSKSSSQRDFFDSSIYSFGANEILGVDPIFSGVIREPSYFTAPAGIGGQAPRNNVFALNAPVLFQTIKEQGIARSEENIEGTGIVEGQETFAVFNPTVPVPLAAFVSPDSTIVLGTTNLPQAYALPETWVKVAKIGKNCDNFENTQSAPKVERLCGDAVIYDEEGQEINFSPEEILDSYPQGLMVHNPTNMPGLYMTTVFVPIGEYTEEPTIQMCNVSGEIANPGTTTTSNGLVSLYNKQLEALNLEQLFEQVKQGNVCIYKQTISNEPLQEDEFIAETTTEKITFTWNLDKIFPEIYPKLYSYQANEELGYFQHCT